VLLWESHVTIGIYSNSSNANNFCVGSIYMDFAMILIGLS
jgi:hypothetical protein